MNNNLPPTLGALSGSPVMTPSSTNQGNIAMSRITHPSGTEPEFEGDLGTNYRAPCVTEDDAGSSSHSEVRSSSPCLADADADVEDSPSGSEERESGSESEPNFSSKRSGGTSASSAMDRTTSYIRPNIGFPPSRSSVTHTTIPSGANFVNTVKFSPGNNPFAVKGLPAGNVSSSSTNSGGNSLSNLDCSGSNRNNNNNNSTSLAGNSLTRGAVTSGRWGTCQPQKPLNWNLRPIIRPSALGSSLGSGVSSTTVGTTSPPSTNFFLSHQSSSPPSNLFNSGGGGEQPNYFAMAVGGGNDNSENSVVSSQQEGTGSTSSSFVLRPPRLPNPFGQACRGGQVSSTGDFSSATTTTAPLNDSPTSSAPGSITKDEEDEEEEIEFATSSSSASGPTTNVNTNSNTDGNPHATSGSTSELPSSTTQSETLQSQNLVFIPLSEKEEGNNNGFDSVSTSSSQGQSQTTTEVVGGATSSVNLFSSLNGSGLSSAAVVASSSRSSQPSGSTSGFVFGRNLLERVQSSSFQPENEEHASTNGISSSTPGASDGLFCAAIRNEKFLQSSSPLKLSTTSSTTGDSNSVNNVAGSSSQCSSLSGAPTAFGGDSSESHSYRKRRFDDAPVLTGEEDEINVVQISCRLFAFDSLTSSWTERGRGQLRLNDRTESNNDLQSRLIVRTKGSLRLMLNTNVWSDMKVDRSSEKSVQFTANDNGHIRLFLIMATVNDTDQLYNALDWRVRTLKSMEDQQQHLSCAGGGGSDDESSSLRKVSSGENVDGGAMKRLVVKSADDSKLESSGDGVDDDESLQDYHDDDSCNEEDVGEDEEGDLDDSPLKKKRFSGPSTSNNETNSGSLNSFNTISSSPPVPTTSENFHGLRPTPTIRINNQEINDFDHLNDECLD